MRGVPDERRTMPETISVPIPESTLRELLGGDEVDAALAFGRESVERGETDEVGAAQRAGGFLSVGTVRALRMQLRLLAVTDEWVAAVIGPRRRP